MILCNENCKPCCDFCVHCIHEEWDEYAYDEVIHLTGAPIGCLLHNDKQHQEYAEGCWFCDGFQCRNAKQPDNWLRKDIFEWL